MVNVGPRWSHRLAAHLSIGSLDRPPFAATAGSVDPVMQITLAAIAGFAAVSDNQLLLRSDDDQRRMGKAIAEHQMSLGSFSLSPLGRPQLSLADVDADAELARAIDEGGAAIDRLRGEGATVGSITAMVQEGVGSREEQLERVAANLDRAARAAEARGIRIGLEAVSRQRMPTSLVERAEDAARLVESVGSPALGLVVDSAHSWFAGEDFTALVRRYASILMTIQIADMPNRVEPGAGKIDFSDLSAALDNIGWTGLIEGEFFASGTGVMGESAVLVSLDELFGTAMS